MCSQIPIRVAYLVTHPIQYQAPLLREIAKDPGIELTVFFCSDISTREHLDPGFGRAISWDIPLLDGYKYEFLPALGTTSKLSFFRPFNYGLLSRLKEGQFNIFWSHGYSRPFNLIAIIMARLLGLKVFVRDDASNLSANRGQIKIAVKKLFFRFLNKVCTGFLTIGTLNDEYYQTYLIPKAKLFRVPYAVDNKFFQQPIDSVSLAHLRADLQLDYDRPVILFASKFIERKCPLDLLNAYFALSPDGVTEPNPYLLFVGDGPMLTETKDLAQPRNWQSIKFLGFKNQTELRPLFDICDVFVLPSVFEPWGLVINEVMNRAKAVIVTDQVGCAPDLVRNNENGYVVQARNIEALSKALSQATSSREHSKKLGQKSLEIIDNWSIDQNVTSLKSAFKTVLGQ